MCPYLFIRVNLFYLTNFKSKFRLTSLPPGAIASISFNKIKQAHRPEYNPVNWNWITDGMVEIIFSISNAVKEGYFFEVGYVFSHFCAPYSGGRLRPSSSKEYPGQ